MPTYEYACRSCQEVFEIFQSMRDAPLTMCPKCGKAEVKRLIGRGAGIIFKGSGFYETDYKRPPQKGEAAAAAKTESTSNGQSSGAASAPSSGGESSKGSDSGKSSSSSSSTSGRSD